MGPPLLPTTNIAGAAENDGEEDPPPPSNRGFPLNYNNLMRFSSSYQAPFVEHVTLDVLLKHHNAQARYYDRSPAKEDAILLAARAIEKQTAHPITNCICLGLGTVAGIFRDSNPTNVSNAEKFDITPIAQLVAFEFWIQTLKKHNHHIENVYFQDPQFNVVDKAFLSSLGYEVIESPASKDLITTKTFLYTPCANLDAVYHTMKSSFPALYIGNDIHHLDRMLVERPYPWIRSMIEKFLEDRDN